MIPWLSRGQPFPSVDSALQAPNGLLAASGDLTVERLVAAYSLGIFPWYSEGEPVLWWSPDPRMVLPVAAFKVSRSLRKTLRRFIDTPGCEVRMDSAFDQVITACASTPREGQDGTWIVPAMVQAYRAWHRAGAVHSVETWIDGELVGGLYGVALGRMFFGESMFAHRTDASKVALAALVAFCRAQCITLIDCQQNTGHLASLGGREIPRAQFLDTVRQAIAEPAPDWQFNPLYWQPLLDAPGHRTDP